MITEFEDREVLFIINPVAGKGKTMEVIPTIKKMMANQDNIKYRIALSKYVGNITEIVKSEYENGCREFIAVGGDGTLSEMVNGFVFPSTEKIWFGIIPAGTGNDFVRNFEQQYSVEEIMRGIIQRNFAPIDIGKVNNHYFVNVCSFGIDGPIIQDTEKYKLKMPGKSSYLFSTIKNGISFNPSNAHVKIDNQEIDGKLLMLAIGNGKYFGGGMKICPDADLNDGFLEVCLVNDVSKLKFIRNISKVYKGKLDELEEVKYYKSNDIEIAVNQGSYLINVDGNLCGVTPAKVGIIKNACYCFQPIMVNNVKK